VKSSERPVEAGSRMPVASRRSNLLVRVVEAEKPVQVAPRRKNPLVRAVEANRNSAGSTGISGWKK